MAKGIVIEELKAFRAARGLTMGEAGALIVVNGKPVTRATWHAWESGRKVPQEAWMFELERVTGVQPNAFYARPERIAPAPVAQAALAL